jgi:hypothetical protein
VGEGQDTTGLPPNERVSVQEAADRLGTTVDAIRKRVQRDTIAHEKDPEGRVWILLERSYGRTRHDSDQDTTGQRQDLESGALISEMRAHNETLREQLEAERQAHAEARRIIAGLVERIPALEAPQTAEQEPERVEPRSAAPSPQDATQPRPWWRRMFGR